METIALPSLEVLYRSNSDRLSEFAAVGITSSAELALFSLLMVMKTKGLTASTAICVGEVFEQHNICQRGDGEPLLEAIIRLFGSVYEAPIEALNFKTTEGGEIVFEPLVGFAAFISREHPDVRTIGELADRVSFDTHERFSEQSELNTRFRSLGIM